MPMDAKPSLAISFGEVEIEEGVRYRTRPLGCFGKWRAGSVIPPDLQLDRYAFGREGVNPVLG